MTLHIGLRNILVTPGKLSFCIDVTLSRQFQNILVTSIQNLLCGVHVVTSVLCVASVCMCVCKSV